MNVTEGGASDPKRPRRRKTRVSFRYPKHTCNPEDLLDFIELQQFSKQWERMGLDDEDDLAALQLTIMVNPKGYPVIEGTNGLRKLRFAPKRWKTGLSGAARVLYKHFDNFGIVLLCLVYGKDETDNISPAVKQHVSKLIRGVERELERRQSL